MGYYFSENIPIRRHPELHSKGSEDISPYPTARRNWRPFGGARGLARFPHQKSRVDAPSTLTKCMKSPRPKRLRKERVPWEAVVVHTLGAAKKIERKAPTLSLITSFLTVPVA